MSAQDAGAAPGGTAEAGAAGPETAAPDEGTTGEAAAEGGSADAPDAALEIAETPAAEADATTAASEPAASDADLERDDLERGLEAVDADVEEEAVDANRGITVTFRGGGSYRFRMNMMSDIPLEAGGPAVTPDGNVIPDRLGQNYWGEQWLRLRFNLNVGDDPDGDGTATPFLRFIGEGDVFFGVAFGDLAQGTRPAAWARDELGYPGLRLRQLYAEWITRAGIVRVGQMGFSWGLGLVSNDGNTPSAFGDPRYGDLVRRVLFATRPFGANVPFNLAFALDWVAWDLIADFDRPCLRDGVGGGTGLGGCGDLAYQGVVAGFYEEGHNAVGAYFAYRTQHNYLQDYLDVAVVDAFARWSFDEPSGGRIVVGGEAALVLGTTSLTRTVERPRSDVQQFMAALQVGRREHNLDIMLEAGYASGDSNTEDGVERRATFDPDHRIGLVLFPEVIAWQTARAAFLATSEDTFGRPSRGAELLPTNGGVSGAFYLFPTVSWRPWDFIEGRLGAVVGFASSDIVDPYRQRAESRSVNFRGGNPGNRDYGVEIDASILAHGEIASGITLRGGIEGGLLIPGHAFDDENGRTMDPIGLARARLGLDF